MRGYVQKCLIVLVGTWISAIGVLFFTVSGMGADPISTFLLGVVNYFPLKFGVASQIFNCCIIIALFFVDRKLLGVGSVINAFFVGFFINLFSPAVETAALYLPATALMLFGPIALGVGIGIYLSANLGSGALECLMIFFSKKIRIPLKFSRIILDCLLVMTGLVLGAPLGVGTILGIALIGPFIEKTLKLIDTFWHHR